MLCQIVIPSACDYTITLPKELYGKKLDKGI